MNTFLKSFLLANEDNETDFILSFSPKLVMQCYSDNVYPFKIFPDKGLVRLDFEPITMLYGGNGSGKSTLLNIIAQKLNLKRSSPFNCTPFFDEYLKFCSYELVSDRDFLSRSKIITSDDVFDFLLDCRAINDSIESRRNELFAEYTSYTESTSKGFKFKTLDDYLELKDRNEARSKTKSQYTARRIPKELSGKSNGESAFHYFVNEIKDNAIYLLDEPENSLSPKLQKELSCFIEESARFYNCQFVISTHSPFFLAMKSVRIYDLDSKPVSVKKWTELENIRIYRGFFEEHKNEF